MIHLDLQPELEAQLAAEAHARGIAPGLLVQQMVQNQLANDSKQRVKSRSIPEAIDRILQLREETSPGAPSIKDLINEGRKY